MIEHLPFEMAQVDIEDLENFETRMSAVDCLFANIIGVNENVIEWCPNDEPPKEDERYAWLWLTTPSMGVKILPLCCIELGKLISAYNSNKMESWFEYMAT
jgi:hypothetical protein